MNDNNMNKVIIIGGDHYNALGLARVFGVNGIKPYGILISKAADKSRTCAFKSKYWSYCWNVASEEDAIQLLLSEFVKEERKPVLVPSSDGAALAIDSNYNNLRNSFILPGINGIQGEIAHLMNKANQAQWAAKAGIKVAKTFLIDLTIALQAQIDEIPFPCIVKPVVSADGRKADITKCDNTHNLHRTLHELISKGYYRVLIQEFINKEYELELWGAILEHSERIPYLLSKHVREWPPVGGSVSLHEFICEDILHDKAYDILTKIRATGYIGNIDVELFMVGDELYLNEVNFRNSGDVYACFYPKVFYPYYSYLDMIGKDTSHYHFSYRRKSYAMNETTDFRHIFIRNCSLCSWIKTFLMCHDYPYLFFKDIKPTLKRYWYCLKHM